MSVDGGILLLRELLVGGLQLLHLGLEGVLGSAELLLLLRDLGLIQGHQRTEPGGR